MVLLFGILFLAAGCSMLMRISYLFYQKERLDEGLELPARILRVESVSSGGGKHGGRSSVAVEYEFTIGNRVMKGDRASIFSESDGLYFRLREAFRSGREVTCFVDRRDSGFSALEKNVRAMDLVGSFALGIPSAIFGSLFLIRFLGVSKRPTSPKHQPIAPSSLSDLESHFISICGDFCTRRHSM